MGSSGSLNLNLSGMVAPALLLFLPWVISCTAELNRTPFDFAEGESELVSGFNIEYGSVKFAIIFIAEYGMIFILSYLPEPLYRKRIWYFFSVCNYLATSHTSTVPIRPPYISHVKNPFTHLPGAVPSSSRIINLCCLKP